MNKQKLISIIKNFIYNILASSIITMALQLIVYPSFAKEVGPLDYGIILTVMGIFNTFISTFGNSLENTRVINNNRYRCSENGDFNILLFFGLLISSFIQFFIYIYLNLNTIIIFLLLLANILAILRTYYSGAFRINLSFNRYIFSNGLTAVGYLIGCVFYYYGCYWPIVFIVGESFGLLYVIENSFLFNFDFKKTDKFKNIFISYINIAIGAMIASALMYLDRLLILPILGGIAVSVYTTASLVGKTLGMVMQPISGVLLGYYSQRDFRMDHKFYLLNNLINVIICIIFFILSCLIGKFIIGILYPTLLEQSIPYMSMANGAAIILILGNMISPIILKFAPSYWQIVISAVYVIIYCSLGIHYSKILGLLGFCISSLIANLVRCIMLFIIGWFAVKK